MLPSHQYKICFFLNSDSDNETSNFKEKQSSDSGISSTQISYPNNYSPPPSCSTPSLTSKNISNFRPRANSWPTLQQVLPLGTSTSRSSSPTDFSSLSSSRSESPLNDTISDFQSNSNSYYEDDLYLMIGWNSYNHEQHLPILSQIKNVPNTKISTKTKVAAIAGIVLILIAASAKVIELIFFKDNNFVIKLNNNKGSDLIFDAITVAALALAAIACLFAVILMFKAHYHQKQPKTELNTEQTASRLQSTNISDYNSRC